MQTVGVSAFSIIQPPVFSLWGRKYISTSVPRDFAEVDKTSINYKSVNLLESSSVSHYSLTQKDGDLVENILVLFSSFQGDVFLEKVKIRISELLDVDELRAEGITPSKKSFFALFTFLSSDRDFCEKWGPSVFISSEGYATLQYMDTEKNQFFYVKFLGFNALSYVIINKNNTLFRLEKEGSEESFFKYLEESQICPQKK